MISVIIPTRDRCDDLLACLGGIAAQHDRSLITQIIVVDDNSRERYHDRVQAFAASAGIPVEMYDSPGSGAAAITPRSS